MPLLAAVTIATGAAGMDEHVEVVSGSYEKEISHSRVS
jgi:hypothetical protein